FGRWAFDSLARRVASAGEPFQLFFDPAELVNEVRRLGFRKIEDLGADQLNERYFSGRADKLQVGGKLGRIISANV
ncbi:MAG: hypothetical protein WBY73_20105, partial [Candidatus Acidiferrales bacterium]